MFFSSRRSRTFSRNLGPILAALVLALNLLLGLRGLGRDDRDLFTMKPFASPLVNCLVELQPPSLSLSATYRQIPGLRFTKRLYLELLPSYAAGLTASLKEQDPRGEATILCRPVHGPADRLYSSSSP